MQISIRVRGSSGYMSTDGEPSILLKYHGHFPFFGANVVSGNTMMVV
jgi:hypothetical protein